MEVKAEIAKIGDQITGNGEFQIPDEEDLSLRTLDIYHGELQALQKEKVFY